MEIAKTPAQLSAAGKALIETPDGPDLTAELEALLWAQAEPLFEQLKQSSEEKMMWIPDSTGAGWLAGAVIAVSAVSPAQAADNYAYGVCQTAIPSMGAEISPVIDSGSYLVYYHQNDPRYKEKLASSQFFSNAKITLVKAPKHGKLVLVDGQSSGRADYHYWSDKEDGEDRFVMQVEKDGVKVRIHYLIKLRSDPHSSYGNAPSPDDCGLGHWKISTPSTEDTPALASALTIATQSLTFADLNGSAVGQTTGTGPSAQITLDDNAAGHTWYIDYTPYLNEEYLPTSNPNEWIAREGSEAAGKMDLLSVLLHEYGHALGIGHSADSHDYMAATLQPGVRRLPSAAELGLMAELLGGVKAELTAAGGSDTNPGQPDSPLNPNLPIGTGLSALLLGRLRRSAYGSWSPAFDSVQIPAPVPQFDTAALTHTHLRKIEPGSFFPRFFPAPFSASFFPFSESCKSRQMRICMQPTPREVVSLNRANCATRHRPALRSA